MNYNGGENRDDGGSYRYFSYYRVTGSMTGSKNLKFKNLKKFKKIKKSTCILKIAMVL